MLPGAVPSDLCQQVREGAMAELERQRRTAVYRLQRFVSPVNASFQRHSIKLPFTPALESLMRLLATGEVGEVLRRRLVEQAVLVELSAIISFPGAAAQATHSDVPWNSDDPQLLSVFVAMQDTSLGKGPTRIYPGTHTSEGHDCAAAARGYSSGPGSGDTQLREALGEQFGQPVMPEMQAGDATIIDVRCFHGGLANESDAARAYLCATFQLPNMDDVEGFTYHLASATRLPLHRLVEPEAMMSVATASAGVTWSEVRAGILHRAGVRRPKAQPAGGWPQGSLQIGGVVLLTVGAFAATELGELASAGEVSGGRR